VLVKHISVTYVDAGQEMLRHQQKSCFEILVYIIGFRNLGRKRDEQGVFLQMYGVQVDSSIAVTSVTKDKKDLFEFIRLPIASDVGVVEDNDIVSEVLKPFCTRKIYM
jgi:hypothetical protein